MTIEFHCPFCAKFLRTADEKAGVNANCPGCGKLVTVPGDSLSAPPAAFAATNPEVASLAGGIDPGETARDCPMCGGQNYGADLRCRVCGEDLAGPQYAGDIPDTNAPLDVGRVLDATWRLFQAKMGLCVVSGLIVMVGYGILIALGIAGYVALLVAIGIDPDGRDVDPSPQMGALLISAGGAFFLIYALVSVYFTLGQLNLMLKIAKGEPAEVTDMFRIGRFFWRGTVAALFYTVLVMCGMCLFLLPGLYLMLMLGQAGLILMDQDVGAIESLKRSYRLTKENLLTIFVLYLIVGGISMACSMVCNLLNLFTLSFAMLLSAVIYQMSMHRPVART